MTFDDLKRFYSECKTANYMRHDIRDKRFYMYYEDIEYLEEKYNIIYQKFRFQEKKNGREKAYMILSKMTNLNLTNIILIQNMIMITKVDTLHTTLIWTEQSFRQDTMIKRQFF